MANEGDGSQEYRVDLAKKVVQDIQELRQQAEDSGIGASFRAALQQIVKRLKRDPQDFGELVQKLPNLQLLVHVGSVYPLTVRFAYHESQLIVYIMKAFLAAQ